MDLPLPLSTMLRSGNIKVTHFSGRIGDKVPEGQRSRKVLPSLAEKLFAIMRGKAKKGNKSKRGGISKEEANPQLQKLSILPEPPPADAKVISTMDGIIKAGEKLACENTLTASVKTAKEKACQGYRDERPLVMLQLAAVNLKDPRHHRPLHARGSYCRGTPAYIFDLKTLLKNHGKDDIGKLIMDILSSPEHTFVGDEIESTLRAITRFFKVSIAADAIIELSNVVGEASKLSLDVLCARYAGT